ncbi:TetR/AcrR family transcriptional regulator [Pseudomaricurvus alkylphenolicus]|uniref:TetR/AcrR family transcriptional regulator n=1 Tax=Pseudomaricurvus alkylphenolicus TaxID=1306991 RepID=UPI00141FC8C1|nr:TetR/AcrR family transcriptional regulator [Pseudomaricurvus alkylphenolicus]NIB40914.1 TetR/AcrR family transcriptional regulator [Pseudomaricurvus alkylphenolicus]
MTKSTPRGAKSPKSKLRRELIIEAAQELLIEEGYSAITMTRVAKQAGISASHFQYYFSTIDDLIVELQKEYLDMYKTSIMEGAFDYMGKEPPERVLERLFDTHMSIIKEYENDVIIWETQAWGARNPITKQYHEAWVEWYTDNVATIIRQINPNIKRNRSYRLAAIISVLMDNAQRFLGEGKPHPARFKGLEKEIKSMFDKVIHEAL